MKNLTIQPVEDDSKDERLRNRMRLLASAFLAGAVFVLSTWPAMAQESALLTEAEREWLAAHPQILLAPDPVFHPVEYFDEKGVYRGIAADYAALLEKKLGIRFRIVRLREWDQVLERARGREIDMFGAAVETPQRTEYMLFTRPYLEFPAVIIVKKHVTEALTLKKLRGMKVAVVSGYAAHDFLKFKYPELDLDVVPDIQTGLRKVSFGMADAFVGNLATASFYLEREGITNLRVAGESGYVYRLAFASRKDWPVLHGILEKGLASIGKEEREAIYNKWISLRPESLLAMRKFWLTALSILGAAMLGIAGVTAWNRALKSQVAQKTEKLLETTELLENIIANIPIYVFWKDSDSRYLGCNQRFASVAGVGRRGNIVGKTDYDLAWRKEEAELIRQSDRQVMEKREPLLEIEETQLQADGQEATLLTSKVPLEDEAGKVIGILGVCADITLRKRDEEALRESQEWARKIIDTALDAVVEIDEEGMITSWNPQAEEVFGWSTEEAIGKQLSETIIPPQHREAHQRGLKHFLATGEGPILHRRIETTALHRDGREFPVELTVAPIRLRDSYSFTAFLRDITERKLAEEAIKKDLAAAKEARG